MNFQCSNGGTRRFAALAMLFLLLQLSGCVTTPVPAPATRPSTAAAPKQAHGLIAQDERFVVYLPGPDDTLASLARRFLGREERKFDIADFNGISEAEPGKVLAIPLAATNPLGVSPNGYQTVPILCYHRVGPERNRMVVNPDAFAAQLDYLARHDYRVIRLSDVAAFLEGKRGLPRRAVVITFDDGWVSAYQHAYPLLKKYGFPATFFLYTDFLGSKLALHWDQISEMARSGLIDFQAHSKTHSNLVIRQPNETDGHYRERVDRELRIPHSVIEHHLSTRVTDYAYPYGDANETVLERMTHAGYRLGLTVNPGGNPFFAQAMMLRRTMIFGDSSFQEFTKALDVFHEVNLR